MQYYTNCRKENSRIENGELIIEARKNDMGKDWTSARLTTKGKVSFVYGKIEVRAKVPAEDGTWASVWTQGDQYIDENSKPAFGDETTYHRAALTLYIPDVKCERCHLQFLTVMSDEFHGVPEGTTCALASAQRAGKADVSLPSCSAVYHSCAPVSINGTMPGAEHTCSLSHHEEQLRWPFSAGKPPASRQVGRWAARDRTSWCRGTHRSRP